MLSKLSVKNFAIIEDIEVNFKDGLTVLTGETGAGKSLIIDSIQLLLGERASLEMIRNGEDRAIISGEFRYKNKRLDALLDSLDIAHEDGIIVVTRIVSLNKSSIKVNEKNVSLNDLKNISKFLADIHQQFDMIKLLNKENYLEIVDGFKYDLINSYKNKYLSSLEQTKQKEAEYVALLRKIDEINKRREDYEYTLKELKDFDLKENEEEEISSRIELLKNFDKIFELYEEIKNLINKDSLTDLYEIKERISKLSDYQNEYNQVYEKINDYYYELEDMFSEIKKKSSRLDYDPQELENLENRRSEISILKKKYNKSTEELIAYQKELEALLSSKEDLDYSLKEKKDDFVNSYQETYQHASDLSKVRREVSNSIEKELISHLSDLAIKCRFEIKINSNPLDKNYSLEIFNENGIDDIDFNIETNIGEGLKPLSKVVSGGEMSRIMLAFKILFIKSSKISTVIFDEVDTGISGEIARRVALKIRDLSLNTQVICITHLPQVASLSNQHIKISKNVIKGRTFTSIKELNLEEKIYEIATMISGGKVTDSQLKYAKEMVLNNE